jgi:hypothetical protein
MKRVLPFFIFLLSVFAIYGQSREKVTIDTSKIPDQPLSVDLDSNNSPVFQNDFTADRIKINDTSLTAIDDVSIKKKALINYQDPTQTKSDLQVIKDAKTEITFTVSLKRILQLDTLYITYGVAPNMGSAINEAFAIKAVQGKMLLVGREASFEITGKNADLIFIVSDTKLKLSNYFCAWAKKKDGTRTIDFIKNPN